MSKTTTKTNKLDSLSLKVEEAQRLFGVSLELADLMEDLLERNAKFSKEFTFGLRKSLNQVSKGETSSINSLKDL